MNIITRHKRQNIYTCIWLLTHFTGLSGLSYLALYHTIAAHRRKSIPRWKIKWNNRSTVHLQYKAPTRVRSQTSGGCLFYSGPQSSLLGLRFIYKSLFDLYIYWKPFIYKLKSFYIQIENDLYINRDPNSGKADSDHREPVFSPFSPQNPVLFKCLFRIIPNSSSLLKTFLARIFNEMRMTFFHGEDSAFNTYPTPLT